MSSLCRADLRRICPAPFGLSLSKPAFSLRPQGRKDGPSTGSGRTVGGGALLAVLAACGLLAGCDRETRDYRGRPLPETAAATVGDPRAALYERNAWHIAQGQRLYAWMGCIGCHAHGGGGMGPPLRDDEWRYGGSMEEVVATILGGRPNGMPAFRGRITEQQAWQLAAFVRAMSAQPRQDALPGRADELSNTEPLSLDERRDMRRVAPKADEATQE